LPIRQCMEILYILVVVGLVVWMRNSISSDIRKIRLDIFNLSELIHKQQQDQTFATKEEKKQEFKQEEQKSPPVAEVTEEDFAEPVYTKTVEPPKPFFIVQEEVVQEPTYAEEGEPAFISFSEPKQKKEPKPSFFESHPDLEKFIGENIINKIGIGILVLGIAFFVKYAIDQQWINEIGRTSIGILAGGLLIGVAHRLQKSFKAFSSVLIGGGLAVLYFTISISFHDYHLFSQTAAFVIMVIITAFAVMLSIAYDRKELAILAIIGGFSTPFILSTGEGNYQVLFTYLLILNVGMLVLAFKKQWTAVTLTCYVFTVLIYGGWIIDKCLSFDQTFHLTTLLFGTLFYLIFFMMSIIYNVKNNVKFRTVEIALLLSNTFLFYSAGMVLLYYAKCASYQGLFTTALGLLNFLFAYFLYKRNNIDKNLVFLLIGLVLTFISLAAPVQLEGNYITMFWAVEAVLLLWFSQKSGIELIRNTSLVVFALMGISLVMDWINLYGDFSKEIPFAILLNKPFITGVISLAAVILYRKLLDKETMSHFMWNQVDVKILKIGSALAAVVLLYLVFLLEINYQMIKRVNYDEAKNVVTGMYNFFFLAMTWFFTRKMNNVKIAMALRYTVLLLMLIYASCYNESIIVLRNDFLLGLSPLTVYFPMHFIIFILAGVALFIYNRTSKEIANSGLISASKWIMVVMSVYLLSAELDHIVTWISFRPGYNIYDIVHQVHKAGYSVLWGCISFLLIRMGMKGKDRDIRIIALTLFTVTILKLFIFDIRGISEGGKILAFISLGILLLVVSFMYQRLKKLIMEDGARTANETKHEEQL
ncbi:MAG: DUF2339 domain-containing protein, partial [Bacteroidota bacterium]